MKTFSKSLFATSLLALFMAIALLACKKDKTADLSGNYTLKANKSLDLKPVSQTAASISIANIEDTRCPPNALCANAGSARVTLKIKDLSIRKEETIVLNLGYLLPKEKKDMAKVKINGTNYIIQIKNLYPYPTGATAEHSVEIMLSKL